MSRALLYALFLAWASFAVAKAADRIEKSPAPPALPTSDEATSDQATSRASPAPPAEPEGADPKRADRNPRVVIVTMRGCGPCYHTMKRLRAPDGPFWTLAGQGWKIGRGSANHIQIVDQSEIPELVQKLNIREYPTVACVENGAIVRSFKDGCSTPLDVWTFGWLLKGENERPKGFVPEVVRVASTGSYPLRGNHWSVDGDWNPSHGAMIGHLRGPNHGSQVAANYAIESWSYEELRSLHDDLHEREMATSDASYADYSERIAIERFEFVRGRPEDLGTLERDCSSLRAAGVRETTHDGGARVRPLCEGRDGIDCPYAFSILVRERFPRSQGPGAIVESGKVFRKDAERT